MFKFNDKLIMKSREDIAEVAGVYPAAQGGFNIPANGETVYVVKIEGKNCYFPESVASMIFDKYIEKPVEEPKPIIEQIADDIILKPKTRKKKITQ